VRTLEPGTPSPPGARKEPSSKPSPLTHDDWNVTAARSRCGPQVLLQVPSNPLASRNRPVKRETAGTASSTGSPPIHPAAPTRTGGSAEPANCAQRFVGPARSSAHKSTYATSNHLVQPGGYVTPLAQSSPWALRIEVTEEERAPSGLLRWLKAALKQDHDRRCPSCFG
jgi:hypothetical protein